MKIELQIVGAEHFATALNLISKSSAWDNYLADANAEVARSIVKTARSRADTPIQRKTIRSGALTSGSSARDAWVKLNASHRTPYAFGAEFGALRYRQFETWRGNAWHGWAGSTRGFLEPSIRVVGNDLMSLHEKHLNKLTNIAFGE